MAVNPSAQQIALTGTTPKQQRSEEATASVRRGANGLLDLLEEALARDLLAIDQIGPAADDVLKPR